MRLTSTRKGVSPLIAAVLLIAFTMAVAAILTAWVTTFTTEQTQQVTNQSETLVQCQYAKLDIFDASYDASGGSEDIDVTLANTGTVNFDPDTITVYAFKDGRIEGNQTLGASLEAGGYEDLTIGNYAAGSVPDRLRVGTSSCSQVSAEMTNVPER